MTPSADDIEQKLKQARTRVEQLMERQDATEERRSAAGRCVQLGDESMAPTLAKLRADLVELERDLIHARQDVADLEAALVIATRQEREAMTEQTMRDKILPNAVGAEDARRRAYAHLLAAGAAVGEYIAFQRDASNGWPESVKRAAGGLPLFESAVGVTWSLKALRGEIQGVLWSASKGLLPAPRPDLPRDGWVGWEAVGKKPGEDWANVWPHLLHEAGFKGLAAELRSSIAALDNAKPKKARREVA